MPQKQQKNGGLPKIDWIYFQERPIQPESKLNFDKGQEDTTSRIAIVQKQLQKDLKKSKNQWNSGI